MFLNFGVSNNEALIGAWKFVLDYRHHPDTCVFQRSEHRLLTRGNIISMAFENVGYPQPLRTPTNEDAVEHSRRDTLMPQHEN